MKGRTEEAGRLLNAPTLDGDPSERPHTDAFRGKFQEPRLGRFVLLREIGSGGMGIVYAAYDEQIDRKVALKILRRAQGDEAQRLRTLHEARAAARISHPNIIAIYEVGETDGDIHIAMEYVDGDTLLEWQTQGRSWRDIVRMYLQVGGALLAAHDAEVVHRDFKPENVLIGSDDRPRVVDFGLARVGWVEVDDETAEPGGLAAPDAEAKSQGRITRPGVIFGTPGYMSPEQHRGGDVDSRSDQWSFCAALYEALYGFLPFAGATVGEQAKGVRGAPRPPPPDTKIPDEIRQALFRGLDPDPERRYSSMAGLIAVLSQELRGGAAAGGLSRQRFSRILVLACLLALIFVEVRYTQSSALLRGSGLVWASLIVVVLLGGLWRRQTLLHNHFHRHVWIIILINMVLFFVQRRIGNALHMSVSQLFPIQMASMASIMAIVATTLIPELFFLPAIPLLSCLLSLTTSLPQAVLTLAYPVTLICLAIGWNRMAQKPRSGGGEGDIAAVAARRRRNSSQSS